MLPAAKKKKKAAVKKTTEDTGDEEDTEPSSGGDGGSVRLLAWVLERSTHTCSPEPGNGVARAKAAFSAQPIPSRRRDGNCWPTGHAGCAASQPRLTAAAAAAQRSSI